MLRKRLSKAAMSCFATPSRGPSTKGRAGRESGAAPIPGSREAAVLEHLLWDEGSGCRVYKQGSEEPRVRLP